MFGDAIRAIYVAIKLNDRDFYSKLQRVNQATDEAVKKFRKMNEALEDIGKYSLGAGIGLSASLGFAVKQAADFEQALVNLQKVMPEDTDFNRIAEAAKVMAKTYGRSVNDVLAAMELWARQGKKQEEVIKLTNAALQWAIAENLDVAEATEYLTYIINQFNMSAEDSTHIIDALNEVSNNFATDSRKLAQSLSDAGASAKALGVSFDELVGYATALHAAGYQAGEAGTFLSYMFSRLYSKEATKAFREAGIEVMDTNGKFRAASEIIAELAKRWDSLTDKQKAMIADSITVGGRVTMIRALMQNYGMAVDATNTALHSQGSAAREVERALKTFNVELAKTWESLKEVGITIGTSLIPVVRPLLKVIQALANAFNALPDPIKNIIGIALGLSAVVLTIGGATLLARAAIFRMASSLFTLIGAEMGAITTTAALRTSLAILARQGVMAFTNLIRAVLSFSAALITNPITWAILGIVAAILLLQDVLVKGWEKSYLGRFVNWLLEKLPFLRPVAEGVATAINYMRRGFELVSSAIQRFIGWIQQGLDAIGPLKYAILGPIAPIVYLVTHMDRLKSATSSALSAVKSAWDMTIGAIIAKIRGFISAIQNAWKTISENPVFKAAQTVLQFTPAGMGLKVAATTVTEHRIPSLAEILPKPAQMISNVQTIHSPRIENRTINVPKIEIHVRNGDPDEIEKTVRRIFNRDFASYGVY